MARIGENRIKICRGDMYLEQLEERIVLDGAAEPSEATADLVGITPGEGIFDGQVHEIEGEEFLFYNNRGWWWDNDAFRWGYCFEYANGNWWEQTDAGWHLMTGAPWDYASFARNGDLIFDGEWHYVNQRLMYYDQTWQETYWSWDEDWQYRFDYDGGPDGRGQWYFWDYSAGAPQWQVVEEVVPLGYMVHDPDGSGGYKQVKLVSGVMMFENRWYQLPAGHDNDWYFYLPGGGTGGAGKAWFFCEGNLDYAYDFGKTEEEAWSGYRGLNHEGRGGYIGESKFLFHEPGGSHEVVEIIDAGAGDNLKFTFEYVHYDSSTFGQTFKVAAVGAGVGKEEWLETNTIKLSDYGSSTSMQDLTDWLHDLWLAHGHYYFDTVMIDGDAVADSNLKIGSATITAANVDTYADLFRQWGGFLATLGHRAPYVEFLAPELAAGDDGRAILSAIETYINQNVPWATAQVWANSDSPPADLSDEGSWDLDWSTAGGDPLAKEHLLYFVFEHPATGEFLYSDVWDDGALYAYNAWDHDGVQYVKHGWRFGYYDTNENHAVVDYMQYHTDGIKWWWDWADRQDWEKFQTWFYDDIPGVWTYNDVNGSWLDYERTAQADPDQRYVFRWHQDLKDFKEGDAALIKRYYKDPADSYQWEPYDEWFADADAPTIDGVDYTHTYHVFEDGEWRSYYTTGGTTKDHWRENEHGDSTKNYYFRDISGYVEWWDFVDSNVWEKWGVWFDDGGNRVKNMFDYSHHGWAPGSIIGAWPSNTAWGVTLTNTYDSEADAAVQDHYSDTELFYDDYDNDSWRPFNSWYLGSGGHYYKHTFESGSSYTYIDEDGATGGWEEKLRYLNSDGVKYYNEPVYGWTRYGWTDVGPDRVKIEWGVTWHDMDGGDNDKKLRRLHSGGPTAEWEFKDPVIGDWDPFETWTDNEPQVVGSDTFTRVKHEWDQSWYSNIDTENVYRDAGSGYFFRNAGSEWFDDVNDDDWEPFRTWFDNDGTWMTDRVFNDWGYSYRDADGDATGDFDDAYRQRHSDGQWQWDDSGWKEMFVWHGNVYYDWNYKLVDDGAHGDRRLSHFTDIWEWYDHLDDNAWERYRYWFVEDGVNTYHDRMYTYEDPAGAGSERQWLRQVHSNGDYEVKDRIKGDVWRKYGPTEGWQYEESGFHDGTSAHVYYEYDKAYYDIDGTAGDTDQWYRDLGTGVWYEWTGSAWEDRGTNPS